jgi:hypothetical protein
VKKSTIRRGLGGAVGRLAMSDGDDGALERSVRLVVPAWWAGPGEPEERVRRGQSRLEHSAGLIEKVVDQVCSFAGQRPLLNGQPFRQGSRRPLDVSEMCRGCGDRGLTAPAYSRARCSRAVCSSGRAASSCAAR